ncbi:hypothetical protein GlitD10_0323, partial [Gloeomargarita lithophora Alchichica-D10]
MSFKLNFWIQPTWAGRIGRFVALATVFLGVGWWLIDRGYKAYWKTTIVQVQTVDFNILAHTLPTKLSLLLLQNNLLELQKTLNSNYSLFGLVVTDEEGKKIFAKSNSKVVVDGFPWQRKLLEQPTSLQDHPYNYLVDPPPTIAQTSYENPYVQDPTPLQKPSGKIIGRIYYIRGNPPSLTDDLRMWLTNPFAKRDAFPLYLNTLSLTIILLLLTFLLTEILINLQKREYQHIIEQLSSDQELLISLRKELSLAEQNIASLESSKEKSCQELANLKQELKNVKEDRECLEESFQDVSGRLTDSHQNNQSLQEKYNSIRFRESELSSQLEQLKKRINEQENIINQSIKNRAEKAQKTEDKENRVKQQIK